VAGLFGQVAQLPYAVPVVADDGSFHGAISKTTLLKFLDRDTPPIAEPQHRKDTHDFVPSTPQLVEQAAPVNPWLPTPPGDTAWLDAKPAERQRRSTVAPV
jgi:hypothetical protein